MELIFHSESDAYLVASQLYNVDIIGNIVRFLKGMDWAAFNTAIALAGVNPPVQVGAKCRLPMPPLDWDEDRPAIYIACLAAYNRGHLHGAWINADRDEDEIREDIEYILSYSPEDDAEEWAIHDYSGFGGMRLSEYESLEDVSRIACAIAEHGDVFAAYCSYYGTDATVEDFQNSYFGVWESEEDFVYEQLQEQGIIASVEEAGLLSCYIDLEKIARDWFMGDYISVEISYKEVYVFANL